MVALNSKLLNAINSLSAKSRLLGPKHAFIANGVELDQADPLGSV